MIRERDAVHRGLYARIDQLDNQHQQNRCDQQGALDRSVGNNKGERQQSCGEGYFLAKSALQFPGITQAG